MRKVAGASLFLEVGWGLALDDFAGLDAAGADAHALACAVDLGLDGLEIYIPATAGGVMGVGDVIAELRAFAAEITFLCHDDEAPKSKSAKRSQVSRSSSPTEEADSGWPRKW